MRQAVVRVVRGHSPSGVARAVRKPADPETHLPSANLHLNERDGRKFSEILKVEKANEALRLAVARRVRFND